MFLKVQKTNFNIIGEPGVYTGTKNISWIPDGEH